MVRFNLSNEAPRARRAIRIGRSAMLTFAVAMAVWLAYASVLFSETSRWDTLHLLGIIGAIWVDAMFGWIAIFGITQPAAWVEIDPSGIRFGFSHGRESTQGWLDQSRAIRLFRTDGVKDWISEGKPAYAASVDRQPFRAVLTAEAFHAILQVAKEQGLTVQRTPSQRKGWDRVDLQ